MRRGFVWLLSATLLASAASFWKPDTPSVVSAVAPRVERPYAEPDLPKPLPSALPPRSLEPAKRDPFSPALAPAAPSAPATGPVPGTLIVAPPAPSISEPQAPALALRYIGRLVTPAGQPLVYVSRGDDAAFAVAPGDRLNEGYVVDAISEEGITLVYSPLGVRVTIPIPPAEAH